MNSTLDTQNVLPLIYPYVLHVIYSPFYLEANYSSFLTRMLTGLAQAPFYSNLSDPARVSTCIII